MEQLKALDEEAQDGRDSFKRIWYLELVYKIKTDFWYLYVVAIIIDCCAIIYFVCKDAYHSNYFEMVFMQIFVF